MKRHFTAVASLMILSTICAVQAAPSPAVSAANSLGLNLFRLEVAERPGNLVLSPWSVAAALCMAREGAEGVTRKEMDAVLLPGTDPDGVLSKFIALKSGLEKQAALSVKDAEKSRRFFESDLYQAVQFRLENALFEDSKYPVSAEFRALLKTRWQAYAQSVAFGPDFGAARTLINDWVAEQTSHRIPALLTDSPAGGTRLILANTLYFKASWGSVFNPHYTESLPFFTGKETLSGIPMMKQNERLTWFKGKDYSAVQLPLFGCDLHFLIILPDAKDGLAAVENNLTPADLARLAVPERDRDRLYYVHLILPKFRIAPPALSLAGPLKALGIKSAFDDPPGSANFSRMTGTARMPLFLTNVCHGTFFAIDEFGIEAAAATFDEPKSDNSSPRVADFHADHPFLFALQDRKTGLCLFLGRLTDPR